VVQCRSAEHPVLESRDPAVTEVGLELDRTLTKLFKVMNIEVPSTLNQG
jgi:hypothetical protein